MTFISPGTVTRQPGAIAGTNGGVLGPAWMVDEETGIAPNESEFIVDHL